MNNIKNKVSCKAKAVDLLARSDQSRKRLIEKLKRSKYSEEEIEETVAWLEEKRYLREEDCCERRFQYMYEDSSYSLRQICVKLMKQGFERNLIHSFIPDDTYERELAAAQRVAASKFKPGMDQRKLMNFLCSKGFDYDVSRSVVNDLLDDDWE